LFFWYKSTDTDAREAYAERWGDDVFSLLAFLVQKQSTVTDAGEAYAERRGDNLQMRTSFAEKMKV